MYVGIRCPPRLFHYMYVCGHLDTPPKINFLFKHSIATYLGTGRQLLLASYSAAASNTTAPWPALKVRKGHRRFTKKSGPVLSCYLSSVPAIVSVKSRAPIIFLEALVESREA